MNVWLIQNKNEHVICRLPGAGVSNYFLTDAVCKCLSTKVIPAEEDPEVVERYLIQYNAVCAHCGSIRGKLYMRLFQD